MKIKRILSILLAVLMLASAFSVVSAADDAEEAGGHLAQPAEGWKTSNLVPTVDYYTGQGILPVTDKEGNITEYGPDGTVVITSAEAKLATMDLRFVKDGYELYVDAYSGEIACRCVATGEIIFSNPYTVGNSTATKSIKNQLLSQLVVKYVDIATGDDNTYYSYEWAATRGQIVVRNIKNGIRVEYTIGREEARMLVPRHIEKNSFETKILNVMAAAVEGDADATFMYRKLMAYYSLNDLSAVTSQTLKDAMMREFPITKKMAIYVLDNSTSNTEMAKIEQLIKTYCPDYSYEDLDDDHMLTEYESEDKNPPLFKMALEYSLDENGLVVRLPANGIRFNEALYQLYSLEILPYMGAGANPNAGYTFFPDGSGTLFDFEKIADLGASTTVTGKVYGQDYAYHTISGTHQEILRYPVFGVVEDEAITIQVPVTDAEGEDAVAVAAEDDGAAEDGAATEGDVTEGEGETTEPEIETEPFTYYNKRGFVAIVEEGDALMELSSYHAVRTSEYNTVRMIVYPRPQDTYNVADAISVGANDTWTVVSARKYSGNYKIRYILLTDDDTAAEKGINDYYSCDYVGMAKAYREYLESNDTLTRLTDADVKDDIPLFIETFGALWSTKKILSIPVDVTIPLTSFDDIVSMYDQLSTEGVSNINFIMRGYTDGGMELESIPYRLKWEKAVEGEYDFEELVAYAEEKGFGVYPDFDFVFFANNSLFDGLTLKKHAVKTIDNRYTSKRDYSATKQTYISYYQLAVSPAYFSHFYEKFTENYLEHAPMGISVSTLGSYLNSDFDEDEPYNREDSKRFTVEAFEYLANNYDKVLTSGGNAYTWKYVDYITDVALDSSRYSQSAAAVPFLGMVLHGYVEFAGSPINMEGNIDYAILKAIESGAGLKFILSYQNTEELKEWTVLSQYYSIRYDIWVDDVVALYNELNAALGDVQTSVITSHTFVDGIRVPDDDELMNDAAEAVRAAIENENAAKFAQTQNEVDAYRTAREQIVKIPQKLMTAVTNEYSEYAYTLSAYNNNLAGIYTAEELTVDQIRNLVTYADLYLDKVVQYCEEYRLANEDYRELVLKDELLSDAKKAELMANIDAIDKNLFCENNDASIKIAEVVKEINDALTYAKGAITVGADALPESYTYEITADEEGDDVVDEISAKVYVSDSNKIVYEEYENGIAFILNFNNYQVMVEVNGIMYTIDAYGYIKLDAKN